MGAITGPWGCSCVPVLDFRDGRDATLPTFPRATGFTLARQLGRRFGVGLEVQFPFTVLVGQCGTHILPRRAIADSRGPPRWVQMALMVAGLAAYLAAVKWLRGRSRIWPSPVSSLFRSVFFCSASCRSTSCIRSLRKGASLRVGLGPCFRHSRGRFSSRLASRVGRGDSLHRARILCGAVALQPESPNSV